MKEERLTIRISTEEKELLKEYAANLDVSVGNVVRKAIREYITNHPND